MTTTFFQQQARARRSTFQLLLLFSVAVVFLVLATYLICLLVIDGAHGRHGLPFINPPLFFGVSTVVLTLIGGGSLYKIAELASGGKSVALLMGGEEIPLNTSDLRQRKILNVVEEMAIASGVPVPPVYLLPDESGINAFAAGFAPNSAVVAVSRGCLDYLTRDELQGVVAHEFSHILNGDMRLNIRLMGLIHGILIISIVGRFVMDLSSSRNRDSDREQSDGKLFLAGLALYCFGVLGAMFGWLIQAAVSRQREFLADASAVQFTRNPDGIGGALKKIGGLSAGSKLQNIHAMEAAHFFFADGARARLVDWFATHPPLEDRIRAIDPHWDGKFPNITRPVPEESTDAPHNRPQQRPAWPAIPGFPVLPGLPGGVGTVAASEFESGADASPAARRPSLAQQFATLASSPEHVVGAECDPHTLQSIRRFIEEIPPEIRELMSEPFSARALIFGMLLDADPSIRDQQLHGLKQTVDSRDVAELMRLITCAQSIPPGVRLTVAHQCLGALQRMTDGQYTQFRDQLEALIDADHQVKLFEFCLSRVVCHHLDLVFGVKSPTAVKYRSPAALNGPTRCLLGMLARSDQETADAPAKAFAAGAAAWPIDLGALPPDAECTQAQLAVALFQFAQATPALRLQLIRCCAACIAVNQQVTAGEYELLRAICSALDCPLPPLVS